MASVVLGLLFTFILICAGGCLLLPKQDQSRLTRREMHALCLAATLIVSSSLVEHFVPQKADDLLIAGGIFAPIVVAAVAGRRFLWYGFFTVIAGIIFRIAADNNFRLTGFTDIAGLLGRYSFAAFALCGLSLISCNYLRQFVNQTKQTCSK